MSQKIPLIAVNYPVYLHLITKRGVKGLEIRRATLEPEIIKVIIDAALYSKPIIVFPTFNDRFRALATLQEKEYIKYNKKKNQYEFLI